MNQGLLSFIHMVSWLSSACSFSPGCHFCHKIEYGNVSAKYFDCSVLYVSDLTILSLYMKTSVSCSAVSGHLFKVHENRERQLLCNTSLMALAFLKHSTERSVRDQRLQN